MDNSGSFIHLAIDSLINRQLTVQKVAQGESI